MAGGKRLRPILVLAAADAVAAARGDDPGRGARHGHAGRLRPRDDSHLLAHPRRPAGDGRRLAAPRPADAPCRRRRRHGDPGRRRPAGRGLRAAGARAGGADATLVDRKLRVLALVAGGGRRRRAWSADRPSTSAPPAGRRGAAAGARRRRPRRHARAQDRSADSRRRRRRRGDGRRRRRRRKPPSTPGPPTSAWPSRSSTTCSTSRALRPTSARPRARTPPPASRPIRRCSGWRNPRRWRPRRSARADAALVAAGLADSHLPAIARWIVERRS